MHAGRETDIRFDQRRFKPPGSHLVVEHFSWSAWSTKSHTACPSSLMSRCALKVVLPNDLCHI